MKKLLIVLGILAVLGIILVMSAVGSYNGLVNRDQAVDAAWAQVENVYQRRADLVPNLVRTVSGAADFEKSTLTAVTEARASVGQIKLPEGTAPTDPAALARFEQAQGQLGSALSRLMVVVERYPELRATQAFRDLQVQLEGTENRIAVERGRYNAIVQDYNSAIRRVPGALYASIFGFDKKAYFSAEAGAEKAPVVDFGGKS